MEPFVVGTPGEVGWIEVICGSMFSGKTEELIRRLRRAEIAGQAVESFKPSLDARYRREAVVSHDESTRASTPVDAPEQMMLLGSGADVVGIDEAQFFSPELVRICQVLARDGTRVIVAGLDQDFRGCPFPPIPELMAVAEHVTKLHAICVCCGAPANHSQRLTESDEQVLVGAGEAYEPRCRRCFVPPDAEAAPPEKTAKASPPTPSAAKGKTPPAKPSGEKTSGEKTSGEKTSGEKTSGEKISGEKISGEKISGEKISGEEEAPGEAPSGEAASTAAAGDPVASQP